MKTLIAAATLIGTLAAAPVHAGEPSNALGITYAGHTLVGGGTWKMPDGTSDRWSAVLRVSVERGEIVLDETTTIQMPEGEQTEQLRLTFAPKGASGFFDVKIDDAVVGDGYCFNDVCHYKGTHDGSTWEETLAYMDGVLYRLGSDKSPEYTVAWQGSMTIRVD